MEGRSYSQIAQETLERAKRLKSGRVAEGYKDNKCYIEVNQLEALLGVGAEVCNLNVLQEGGDYIHELVYQRHLFVTSTKEPLAPVVQASRR